MDILLWHEILEPYELAVKELQVKFRHLIKEHHGKGLYSPIESVSGRVKSVSSILEKCRERALCPKRWRSRWRISRASASSASSLKISKGCRPDPEAVGY